jgi:hypothetical protein
MKGKYTRNAKIVGTVEKIVIQEIMNADNDRKVSKNPVSRGIGKKKSE